MKIFRLDDVFDLHDEDVFQLGLSLFIFFTENNCCSFVLLEKKSHKVLIIGDAQGDSVDPVPVDPNKIAENDENLFTNLINDSIAQQFKRYECLA